MKKNDLKEIHKLSKTKKIVLCHGVFDILHSGHIYYFEQAKKLGDILVVSVTSDKFVNKGPNRPVNQLNERILLLKNIKSVDYVLESNYMTAKNIITEIKPSFFCKGPDYNNKENIDIKLNEEIATLKKYGGKFVTVKHQMKSSSKIIDKLKFENNESNIEIVKFIKLIKKKYSYEKINKILNELINKKALILGELIIDKYIFADAIGKSGKDSILVYKQKSEVEFLGGAAYIANLCSSFLKTQYLFHVGKKNTQLKFIKNNLNKKIKYKYFYKDDSPTITKLRYLDDYRKNKIIGFYDINDKVLTRSEEKIFIKKIKQNIKNISTLVLINYGHGEITQNVINYLKNYSDKLCLNNQVNSFNTGHYNIGRLKKVCVLCMNETELRHELRDSNSSVPKLAKELRKKIDFKYLVVTRGKFGSLIFYKNKELYCPAFEKKPIDSTGSGDTFFTLVSLCLTNKLSPLLSIFLASIAASYSVKNIGNKDHINYKKLLELTKYYLVN